MGGSLCQGVHASTATGLSTICVNMLAIIHDRNRPSQSPETRSEPCVKKAKKPAMHASTRNPAAHESDGEMRTGIAFSPMLAIRGWTASTERDRHQTQCSCRSLRGPDRGLLAVAVGRADDSSRSSPPQCGGVTQWRRGACWWGSVVSARFLVCATAVQYSRCTHDQRAKIRHRRDRASYPCFGRWRRSSYPEHDGADRARGQCTSGHEHALRLCPRVARSHSGGHRRSCGSSRSGHRIPAAQRGDAARNKWNCGLGYEAHGAHLGLSQASHRP